MNEVQINKETFVYVSLNELNDLRYKAEQYTRLRAKELKDSLTKEQHQEWIDKLKEGQRVEAVKLLRFMTGCSLSEGISIIRNYEETKTIDLTVIK